MNVTTSIDDRVVAEARRIAAVRGTSSGHERHDNVSQSLSQTLSQLLGSLLTVVGVVGIMIHLSPALASIALVTIPVSMALAGLVMKRSQALFVSQWRRTGALAAQVEEAFRGTS